MKKLIGAIFALALSSFAHAQDAMVVQTCGTVPSPYSVGSSRLMTVDVNGRLCLSPALSSFCSASSSGQLLYNNAGTCGGVTGTVSTAGVVISAPNDSVYFGLNAAPNKATISASSNDVCIGRMACNALPANDPLTFHTVVGMDAMLTVSAGAATSAGSTVVGQKAITAATSANRVTAVGSKAGSAYTAPNLDVFVGFAAAQFATDTNLGRRVFVGYNAGNYDSGDQNIMVGYNAGPQNAPPNNNPTTGINNIGIGPAVLNALKGAVSNVAIGNLALNLLTTGNGNIVMGDTSGNNISTASNNVIIGYNAGQTLTTGSRNILLGEAAGKNLANNAGQNFVAGSDASAGAARIDNVYFGRGYQATAPSSYTIRGTGAVAGTGTDVAGGNVTVSAGLGTGAAAPASVILASTTIGSTGTTAQTQITGATVNRGSLIAGPNTALATNATDGFLYIPTSAGTPTGTPTTQTGAVAMVYDSSNNQLYVYNGGWKQPKTPAAAAIVNWQ